MDNEYAYTEDIPGVIVVGGINSLWKVCFSPDQSDLNIRHSIGKHVDIYAPSKDLITTDFYNDFTNVSGTSNAAPMVSAAIGLMLDINPSLTPQEIECFIKNNYSTINDKSDYPNMVLTGRLDLEKLLKAVQDDLNSVIRLVPTDINYPITYSNTTILNHDLYIKQGGVLEILNTTFRIATGKKIIVEEGGKLTINNSILTNYNDCSDNLSIKNMWGGILVRSHGSSQSQDINTSGYVNISNNSIIENAIFGVDLTEWFTLLNTSGGILVVENSQFLNCRYGFKYSDYLNPTNIEENLTKFNNVDFVSNKPFQEFNMQGTNTFAWISGVRGLKFQGCRFINELENYYPRGIGSWDAKFWVTRGNGNTGSVLCPNMPLGRSSEFVNLSHGIHSVGSNYDWNRHQTIGAKFKNCLNGIWMGNDLLSEVIDCDFDIDNDLGNIPLDPNNPTIPSIHQIYANSSKGFSITDSKFDFKIDKNPGGANLFSIRTHEASDGWSNNSINFNSEIAKCRFDNTASNYDVFGHFFTSFNYNLYFYCNYYSGSLSKAWSGSDGSFLNSQRGQKKSNYQTGIQPNQNTTTNNIFDYCVSPNLSIQGIPNQLFNKVFNPNQNNSLGNFQYFIITPNSTEYPTGLCNLNATLPFVTNPQQWSIQCDFYNPEPWFKLEDVFCRDQQFPLIPLRNSNVVTGQIVQTRSNPENDTTIIEEIFIQNDEMKFNEFMVKYKINNEDLIRKDTLIKIKIKNNFKSYTIQEKIAAYDILIHFFEEEGFKSNYLFEEISKTNKSNLNFKNQDEIIFNIYPNPSSSGCFHILTDLNYDKVEIYSFEGKLIQVITEVSKDSIFNFKIENNGFFIIKIFNNNHNIFQTKLLVLEK